MKWIRVVRLSVGTMFLCLALAMENVQFAEEKEPNSRWSNELFTALDHDSTCASLFCTWSFSFSSLRSDQLSNICLSKKKKKVAFLFGRLIGLFQSQESCQLV